MRSEAVSESQTAARIARNPGPAHLLRALFAVSAREFDKFLHQRSRFLAALLRPLLWLFIVAVGFEAAFDGSGSYRAYMLPGLLGVVLLFHGMQSALSMVYEREMGMMRLLLTAPLPRAYLLFCKLAAISLLAVGQAYLFLGLAALFGVGIGVQGWLYLLPALLVGGAMLGALGLAISVYVHQLENFAGLMNFVIFPMFFLSSALYPLSRFAAAGADYLVTLALLNPFTHLVELLRAASEGRSDAAGYGVMAGCTLLFFLIARTGYDPERGIFNRR